MRFTVQEFIELHKSGIMRGTNSVVDKLLLELKRKDKTIKALREEVMSLRFSTKRSYTANTGGYQPRITELRGTPIPPGDE